MATSRWDNIEILQAIDRIQQETDRGGPIRSMNGACTSWSRSTA
jgi:hypothetical protein